MMRVDFGICAPLLFALAASCAAARAELLPVVNGSFESPSTTFVTQSATGWTLGGPPESAISGVFNNNSTQPGDPAHLTNAVGDQLAFIGTETGNEMTQFIPSAVFEPATQYTLRVGIALSNTLMPHPTDAVHLALYYVDSADQRHTVASTDIVNSPENALKTNLVQYFTAQSAVLFPDDAAMGKSIGIQLSTIGISGRYFDLENVTVDAELFVARCPSVVVDYPAPVIPLVQTPEPGFIVPAGLVTVAILVRRRSTNSIRFRGCPQCAGNEKQTIDRPASLDGQALAMTSQEAENA